MRHITKGANGLLLELLVVESGHVDRGAADLFRKGAPIVGDLERYLSSNSSRASAAQGCLCFVQGQHRSTD